MNKIDFLYDFKKINYPAAEYSPNKQKIINIDLTTNMANQKRYNFVPYIPDDAQKQTGFATPEKEKSNE